MKSFFKSLSRGKLTLLQWSFVKYLIWFIINVFFIIRGYILIDVFIINIFLILGHACTRVHALGEGLYMGMSQVRDRTEQIVIPPSFNKEDLN